MRDYFAALTMLPAYMRGALPGKNIHINTLFPFLYFFFYPFIFSDALNTFFIGIT